MVLFFLSLGHYILIKSLGVISSILNYSPFGALPDLIYLSRNVNDEIKSCKIASCFSFMDEFPMRLCGDDSLPASKIGFHLSCQILFSWILVLS